MPMKPKEMIRLLKKKWFHKNKSKWFPCENEEF